MVGSAYFIDEFELDKHRTQMLDIIKTSGSGAAISASMLGAAPKTDTISELQEVEK